MPRNCCQFEITPLGWVNCSLMHMSTGEQGSLVADLEGVFPIYQKREGYAQKYLSSFFTRATCYSGNEYITVSGRVCKYLQVFCTLPCSQNRFVFMWYFRMKHLTWILERSTQQMLEEWMIQESNPETLFQELYCKIFRAHSNSLVKYPYISCIYQYISEL